MRPIGQVTVFAPDRNWTACGHVKTLDKPLRVRETVLADGTSALTTDGAPSDCVALALLGVLPQPVDLVVTGINPGENVGHDITYSGTVTAAMEAAIWGLPGVAVSLQIAEGESGTPDYTAAAQAAQHVVQLVIREGLPKGLLLNVNIPCLPQDQIRGYQVTRQGQRIYKDILVERLDPRNRTYYWIGGEAPSGLVESGTDYGALSDGYISVTPIQLDLTAHSFLPDLRGWINAWDRE
jgi:5'-nucleotidase